MARDLGADNAFGRIIRSKHPDHPTGWYDRVTGRATPKPRPESELREVPITERNLTEVARFKARHYATKSAIRSMGSAFTRDQVGAKVDRLEDLQRERDLTAKEKKELRSARRARGYFRAVETIFRKMAVPREEARERFAEFFGQLAQGKDLDEARQATIYRNI